jgi:hypothetical protein
MLQDNDETGLVEAKYFTTLYCCFTSCETFVSVKSRFDTNMQR